MPKRRKDPSQLPGYCELDEVKSAPATYLFNLNRKNYYGDAEFEKSFLNGENGMIMK